MNVRIVGMLHNIATDTWHSVPFMPAPMPGGSAIDRVRSIGHHTVGFPTRSAANEYVAEKHADALFDAGHCEEWTGEGVPAITAFVVDGRIVEL